MTFKKTIDTIDAFKIDDCVCVCVCVFVRVRHRFLLATLLQSCVCVLIYIVSLFYLPTH